MYLKCIVMIRCSLWILRSIVKLILITFHRNYRFLIGLFLAWICLWISFRTTTRRLSVFIVATIAWQFDLKCSWHFQNTTNESSFSLKYRYWSINRMCSPFFDLVNSTLRSAPFLSKYANREKMTKKSFNKLVKSGF